MLAGCGKPDFSDAEKKTIASLALSALPPLKPDTTNRFADVPAAAALGSTLFFDQGMSRDGTVSCSTCHKIDRQFQDDLPQAVGVGRTNRRTMPLAGVARDPWFFWDGRRDSLWAQALTPLENPLEQAGNRAAYAHYIKARFGERYERIFGPLPDFSGMPLNASPLGNRRREGGLERDERRTARRDQPRLCQYRQGDRRLRTVDRAGADALRPLCAGPRHRRRAERRCGLFARRRSSG